MVELPLGTVTFDRTLNDEWARVRIYRRNQDGTRALDRWMHHYDHHRLGPIARGWYPRRYLIDTFLR
jgi:hypothetical protein